VTPSGTSPSVTRRVPAAAIAPMTWAVQYGTTRRVGKCRPIANAAVTGAFAIGRHFPARRVVPYWTAQVIGAIAAAGTLRLTLGDVPLGVTQPSGSDAQSLVWEAVLTFFVMLVIVAVATDTRAAGQGAALAIGGAVGLGALVGGPISGASMNPARSIGPAVVSGDLAHLWIYLVPPPVGAVAAILVYRFLRPIT